MHKGKIKKLVRDRGFGFIKDSESQEKVFVHMNEFLEEINEGDVVSFQIGKGPKGPIAMKVKLFTESD